MDILKEFIIPFKGLSEGDHKYSFEVGNQFFEKTENPDIRNGKFLVSLNLEKKERMMILDFYIQGYAIVECDRCLEDLEISINTRDILYIKFGDVYNEESENVMVIADSDYKFDTSRFINDYITLGLPMRKIHGGKGSEESRCNENVEKTLTGMYERKKTDPRWEKLKELKEKIEK
ncbi:MAG: DUF177 domain-containing protein [Bacteroidales bacterium]|nr:DUF177 domain-containing protein [Bacteroidales bacterium]